MSGGRAVFEAINGPAPGKFLETTHGTTHYVLEGPEDAPLLVVLQHGIGGALSLFDRIAADLVMQGCRVLRYEFYDRGYSESDPQKYPVTAVSHALRFTLDVYVEQCREVLERLGLADKDMVHCGHSCGGVAGIGYAARYPACVKGLCLIDSVCLPASKPLAARIADLPVLGNLVVRALGRRTMVKFTRGACRDPDGAAVRDFLERQARNVRENLRFFAACRSTSSHCKGFVGSAEDEFRAVCRAKIPMRLIWGKDDTSVPYAQCLALGEIARAEGTDASEVAFDGMPHNVFFEDAKPEECSRAICGFVAECTSRGSSSQPAPFDPNPATSPNF